MTSEFAAGTTYRRVFVERTDLDSPSGMKISLVTDLQTKGQFTVPSSAPGRINPQEGDLWQLSRETGYWAFDKLIAKGPEKVTSTMSEVVQALQDLGLIEYIPAHRGLSPDTAPLEMPYGAYIGEIRAFLSGTAPAGWLPADGSLQSRVRYRELFNMIGTTYSAGDNDTTFGIPDITGFPGATMLLQGNSAWYTAWGALDRTLCSSATATTASTFVTIASRAINQIANRLYSFHWNGALVPGTGGEVGQVRVTFDGSASYTWNISFNGVLATVSLGGIFWTQMTAGVHTVNLEFARISGGTSIAHTGGSSNSVMFTVSDCGPGASPNPPSEPPDTFYGSWISPTLTGQWTNYGAGWQPARYRREGDTVRIEGLVKTVGGVASGQPIFTLRSDMWPAQATIYTQQSSYPVGNTTYRVDVLANGTVVYNGSATLTTDQWLSINLTVPIVPSALTASPVTYYICASR